MPGSRDNNMIRFKSLKYYFGFVFGTVEVKFINREKF